jgi:hypothetical protein
LCKFKRKSTKEKKQNLGEIKVEFGEKIVDEFTGKFDGQMEKEEGSSTNFEKEIKIEIDDEEEEEMMDYEENDAKNDGNDGLNSVRQKFADKFKQENQINLEEWRKKYEELLANKFNKYHRVRFLFCRSMLKAYGEKLRQIKR